MRLRYLNVLKKKLGREPTFVELQAFSVMWSEHCGYSHTKRYIKRLPKTGFEGNAGVVNLDDYYSIAFKIESHNHPSAIEPYNGAATGVGGIIRDVLAMGARPTAIFDSLHMPRIIDGIIEGIADYGNSIGVPTVGGELRISSLYEHNPLVNVLAAGVVRNDMLVDSKATKPGQVIVVFGGATGRDGIHGASFASEDLTGEKATKLSIQVGDPFAEKMLIEAFLRMVEEGLIEGAQDLGAGGVLSATSELVARGNLGAIAHLDRVPLREQDMEPWEILISESQERMAVVTSPEKAARILKIAKEYLLFGGVVAEVIEEPVYRVLYEDQLVMEVPVQLLANAPEEEIIEYTPGEIPKFDTLKFEEVNAREVFEQYDHMVGTDTVLPPGFGAAVMRIKKNEGYSLVTHSRADLALQNTYWGTFIAVLESVRKTLAVGATPLAITNCVNYGDPDVDPVGLSAMMTALKDACEFSNVPVASGNASLYNTYQGKPIPPTLVVGMLGKVDPQKVAKPKPSKIFAVGWQDFDLEREKELWKAIKKLASEGAFILASSQLLTRTHVETFREFDLKISLRLPEVESAHQMVLVFSEKTPTVNVPVKEIGALSR
ncbi:phosphoribosylformylglycinamidine synthase subunit PurL [Thermotoga sp.]|uniref:phosphoribosylformylglycinamidine synthase subunit PurL n=1 Tax=Thermotoga sp. TaxID=28240 RepID=UPI0025DA9BB9|nr:phosphoribosylformylglycinamidine synthase subunit PurL [Thermotoga sp.]MCD6551480.1 phosphoribosylformylglycinamidine synthase subunit PurL [Thermotoga sp.]